VLNNYSIVASRGELARNNRAASETATTGSVQVAKKRASLVNGRIRSKEESPATRSGNLAEEEPRNSTRGVQRGITKSASVPKDLKEGALRNREASVSFSFLLRIVVSRSFG